MKAADWRTTGRGNSKADQTSQSQKKGGGGVVSTSADCREAVHDEVISLILVTLLHQHSCLDEDHKISDLFK